MGKDGGDIFLSMILPVCVSREIAGGVKIRLCQAKAGDSIFFSPLPGNKRRGSDRARESDNQRGRDH